ADGRGPANHHRTDGFGHPLVLGVAVVDLLGWKQALVQHHHPGVRPFNGANHVAASLSQRARSAFLEETPYHGTSGFPDVSFYQSARVKIANHSRSSRSSMMICEILLPLLRTGSKAGRGSFDFRL